MAKVLDGNYDNRSENLPEQEHSYNLEDLKAFVNDFGGEYEQLYLRKISMGGMS